MNAGLMLVGVLGGCAVLVIAIVVTYNLTSSRQGAARALLPVDKGESASLKYLKERCRVLEQRDHVRKLYMEVTRVLSTAATFDELARACVDAVCGQLRAAHGALLWIGAGGEQFEARYATGYGETGMLRIPVRASLAGTCLLRKEPVFAADPRQQVQYVPMGGVVETNLLCAPVRMFKDYRGVLRFANIDTDLISPSEIVSVFSQLTPLLSSALEKALIAQDNERRKNELAAISGVTQALNKTLDLREICGACARHLKPVFNYSYFMVARYTAEGDLSPLVAVPREIRFNESEASSRIILRNLCSRNQPVLVEDVHRSDAVKSQNRDIGSLMAMPITIGNQPFGTMVVTVPLGRAFDTDDMNVLAALSEHLAVTIERAAYFRRQEEQASRDGLTGLLNHRSFQDRLRLELQRYLRYKRPVSLIMLDIDQFKKFNDTYGHQSGDLVLKSVADVLRRSIRTTDMAFRYGGEEMALLLPETELDPAALLAGRLCAGVAGQPVRTSAGDLRVTASFGVAQADAGVYDAESLVSAADKALYFAKENGRNCVCVHRGGEVQKVPQRAPGNGAA